MSKPPFPQRVSEAMARRGYTLRSFCRAVELDPSFFSKVLAGKRSPPSEEAVLRRIAGHLGLDAAELIVAAGRIPSEWSGLWTDAALFARVHGLAGSIPARDAQPPRQERAPAPEPPARRDHQPVFKRRESLADELL